MRVELALDALESAIPLQHGSPAEVDIEVDRILARRTRDAKHRRTHTVVRCRTMSVSPLASPLGRTGRRFFIPEVLQTSGMDCGPAALKALLEGFRIPVSYGRLREACHTDVDGTSIDTLEEIAQALNLHAEQVMIPVDHVLLDEAAALPAIAVARTPSGGAHFMVVWRRHGPWVQVSGSGARTAMAFPPDLSLPTLQTLSRGQRAGMARLGRD